MVFDSFCLKPSTQRNSSTIVLEYYYRISTALRVTVFLLGLEIRSPGSPNSSISSLGMRGVGIAVDHIAISIVLDSEVARVPPVVEDLGPVNMAPDSPEQLVSLLGEPIVTQQLRIKILNFKRCSRKQLQQ